jgi:hypothetical protein
VAATAADGDSALYVVGFEGVREHGLGGWTDWFIFGYYYSGQVVF